MTGRALLSAAAERRQAVLDRITANTICVPETGCWLWMGPDSGSGRGGDYPRMSLDGRTVAVHRVIAIHFWGFLHPGRQVDHTCRNRRCVNPAHLEPVTHRVNQKRRDAAKGT